MNSLPLNLCTPSLSSAIINRSYALLHFTALLALIFYRLSSLPSKPTLPFLSVFASELHLSFIWLCQQAYRWRPVSRTTFLERLPADKDLPSIDVFICTADPKKEPPVDVMNTVLSAMALDYPPEKLSVYVSDDGGSSLTLHAMRESWVFANSWLPFCKRFGIKTRCPEAYFSGSEDCGGLEYWQEKEKIKRDYQMFKERVERGEENDESERTTNSSYDHPPTIEVINDESRANSGIRRVDMPLLVYVSREKRPSHRHHFKAGALNVLLRVSGAMTNSPYVLVLDCDMYCNDATSARQAMCFHLDPKLSPSLAFVQFPQKFRNVCKSDIYDGQLRTIFVVMWPGMDGLDGPMLSGTGFYMKRQALYGNLLQKDLQQMKQSFGHSNEFIKSVNLSSQPNVIGNKELSSKFQEEAQFLASCTYEKHTAWGDQIGFLYHSVVEDYFTGFILHCKGWTSVLCNPSMPAFLGSAPMNLNDTIVQGTRWSSGLTEVALSRFCPFIHGLSRMSLLQTMCYGYFSVQALYSLSLLCLATLPQLCLLNGIPLYPEASSWWFLIFSFIFLASFFKHLEEVLSTGGSIQTWWNEQRVWMIKSVTVYAYGGLDAFLKWVGMREANFLPTNKVANDEEVALYKMGKINFQTSTLLLAPIVTLVTLNIVSFIGGVSGSIVSGRWKEMFGQVFLSLYILVVNLPVIEGMLLRKDKGRVPFSLTLISIVLSLAFLYLGSLILLS